MSLRKTDIENIRFKIYVLALRNGSIRPVLRRSSTGTFRGAMRTNARTQFLRRSKLWEAIKRDKEHLGPVGSPLSRMSQHRTAKGRFQVQDKKKNNPVSD